jgi:RNA polymerase sigma-70 factor (ECF subfamily)
VLERYLANAVEDIAIEALEELVPKVEGLRSADELKRLVASIAHNRAVSLLRQHFAARRGGGNVESLDAVQEASGDLPEAIAPDSPLAALEKDELAKRLNKAMAALKPPLGELVADSFIRKLSHKEIADKHGLAVGSVGVYVKRGLEALRRAWGPDKYL